MKARPPVRPSRFAPTRPGPSERDRRRVALPTTALPIAARPTVAMVCTANRCRSPLAEALMRREAAERGLQLDVFSLGFLGSGQLVPEKGVEVAGEFGLDLSDHVSEQLTKDRLAVADLVLGMSREHARGVVSGMPQLWPRAFTLKQFSRFTVGQALPRRSSLAAWVESAAADRSRQELLGAQPHDDIADPMGLSKSAWRQTVREIRFHVIRILEDCAPLLSGELARPPMVVLDQPGAIAAAGGQRRRAPGPRLFGWPARRSRSVAG